MTRSHRSPSLRLLARLSFVALALGATALPGCGDDVTGRRLNQAATSACEAACEAEASACPGIDGSTCLSLCDAYGITVDENSPCEAAFLEWQACEEGQAYTCSTFDGTTYAVPADLDACATESDAHDAACF